MRQKRFSQLPIPIDPWMTTKFIFYDEEGNRVSISGKNIVDIARQLDYRYEDVPVKSDGPEMPAPSSVQTLPDPPVMVATASNVFLSADKK